jgi:hypothetical protein
VLKANIGSKFAAGDGNLDNAKVLRYAQGVCCSQMQVSLYLFKNFIAYQGLL